MFKHVRSQMIDKVTVTTAKVASLMVKVVMHKHETSTDEILATVGTFDGINLPVNIEKVTHKRRSA